MLNMSWGGFGVLFYIVFGVIMVGFVIWSFFLCYYLVSLVILFVLVVLVLGMFVGWLLFGECFDLDSLLVCVLVFVGLVIILLLVSLL